MERSTRVIFVEGVPFTGKSTLSEYLTEQLRLNGLPARWLSEGTMLTEHFPRVMAGFDDPSPVPDETLREEWRAFVEAARSAPEILVADSALSYMALYPLHAHDRPLEEIAGWMREVAALCAPLEPRVIHLTGDMARRVPASIAQRGPEWQEHLVGQADATPYQKARGRSGVEGVIQMLEETQALSGRLFAEGWQSITLDGSNEEWAARQRAVLDFLGLAEIESDVPSVPLELLRSYVGEYGPEEPPDAPATFSIRMEGESPVLYRGTARYDVLVPRSERYFHVRSTTIDAEFELDAGVVRALLLHAGEGPPRRYVRR